MLYSIIKKTLFVALTVGVFASEMFAQEGLPVYADYLTDNYYLIHPSMAGASACSQVRVTARSNWVGQDNAPGLQTLSYNSRINRSSAFGFNAFNDRNGFHSQRGLYATYGHHLMFSRDDYNLNMLSFGLSLGALQYSLDQSEFVVGADQLAGNSDLNTIDVNIDFGFSYHLRDLYAHFTIKNLIKNDGVNNEAQLTDNLRRYLVSVGYVFEKSNGKFMLEPSVLYQFREGIQQSTIDLNLKTYFQLKENTLFGGVSVRRGLNENVFQQNETIFLEQLNYVSPFAGIKFNQISISYTYTQQLNDSVFFNGSQHQITLGYDFNCRKKRFHCNCPAVN